MSGTAEIVLAGDSDWFLDSNCAGRKSHPAPAVQVPSQSWYAVTGTVTFAGDGAIVTWAWPNSALTCTPDPDCSLPWALSLPLSCTARLAGQPGEA